MSRSPLVLSVSVTFPRGARSGTSRPDPCLDLNVHVLDGAASSTAAPAASSRPVDVDESLDDGPTPAPMSSIAILPRDPSLLPAHPTVEEAPLVCATAMSPATTSNAATAFRPRAVELVRYVVRVFTEMPPSADDDEDPPDERRLLGSPRRYPSSQGSSGSSRITPLRGIVLCVNFPGTRRINSLARWTSQ